MRTRVVFFLGFAFALYWLLVNDPLPSKPLTLDPVKPDLVQILNPPYAIEPSPPSSPAKRAPAHKPAAASLRSWLMAEGARVGLVDAEPDATIRRLKLKASRLSSRELELLKSWALSQDLSGDERFLAVYMISLSGAKIALSQLEEISLAEIPKTATERLHSEEVVIRARAIEGLVQKLNSKQARGLLREILSRTSDPMLAQHVKYWLNRLT